MNDLTGDSDLFIFSDGPKDGMSGSEIDEVRKYLKTIEGFKSVTIYCSETNKGLASSVISGVTKIMNEFERVIVLEDDLITSPNFLCFMNEALDFYEHDASIFSISGYTMDLPSLKGRESDYYIGLRASSWGWGTWIRSWQDIDWEIQDYKTFKRSFLEKTKFNKGGSDLTRMLEKQMSGKIDSWAVRWCYNQYRRNQFTIFPSISKVESIGIGENATHTKTTRRFDTKLDNSNKKHFEFDAPAKMSVQLIKEFKSKFSVYNRLIDKLKNGF